MPHLKVNYQKQRTGKESMKLIVRHSKVNNGLFVMNPAVTYEMDYYIPYLIKKLFSFYQELKTCKIETFENSRQYNQSDKRNLDNIMDH